MKNNAKSSPTINLKNITYIDAPKMTKQSIQKLKNVLQSKMNGTEHPSLQLNYASLAWISLFIIVFAEKLGINYLNAIRVFCVVMHLSLFSPELCYKYQIHLFIPSTNPRRLEQTLTDLVDRGVLVRFRRVGHRSFFYSLSVSSIDLIVEHLDELKSAPFE